MITSIISFLLLFLWIECIASQNRTKLKYSGMTFTNERYCPNISMDSKVGLDSMKHLATTGTNTVAIVVTQYQMNITSTNIYPIYNTPILCTSTPSGYCVTATNESLINTINNAHNLGMKVLLKPHIDLINDSKNWRGNIGIGMTQNQWNNWFNSYENYIMQYAEIAANTSVEMFSVSTELVTPSTQETFWRALVPKIRNIYKGILTDAANWSPPGKNIGELVQKNWWDIVDIIGCDEYYVSFNYGMINGSYPTLTQLLNVWKSVEQQMFDLHNKWNKSIIFTEIGYCSGVNAKCYANGNKAPNRPTNESLYAMYNQYEAVLTAMSKYEWFEGIFWWNWASDAAFGGDGNSCMDPKYKPTENLLREWYNATEEPPPPPNYPVTCECWL
eukprot:65865_1